MADSRILACRSRRKCRRPAECDQAPSTYEMEGAWPGHAMPVRRPVAWLFPAPRASRQCQSPARSTGFPALLTFPGVASEVVPVSSGEAFLLLRQGDTQERADNYFYLFRHPHDVHRNPAVIRIYQRFSTTLCTTNPQVARRNPGTTMMTSAIGWSYNDFANHPTRGGHPANPRRVASPPPLRLGAPGDYRPAESSASSATYGWPSRQAAICSGRP
jgi:hypothetical protein